MRERERESRVSIRFRVGTSSSLSAHPLLLQCVSISVLDLAGRSKNETNFCRLQIRVVERDGADDELVPVQPPFQNLFECVCSTPSQACMSPRSMGRMRVVLAAEMRSMQKS